METTEEWIQKTAQEELGTMVGWHIDPLQVAEIFLRYTRKTHFITLAYECPLPVDVYWKNNK